MLYTVNKCRKRLFYRQNTKKKTTLDGFRLPIIERTSILPITAKRDGKNTLASELETHKYEL